MESFINKYNRSNQIVQMSISLPFAFDVADPVIRMMLREAQDNPSEAQKIFTQILENYEPCSSQLEAYAKAIFEIGQKPPKSLHVERQLPKGKIFYEKESGLIRVGNLRVGRLRPKTREHCFFLKLYENREQVISYEDLYRHIQAFKPVTADGCANYCHKLKGEVKKCIEGIEIDRIIKPHPTAEGTHGYYMLAEITEK